jgi:hypothetical protein
VIDGRHLLALFVLTFGAIGLVALRNSIKETRGTR